MGNHRQEHNVFNLPRYDVFRWARRLGCVLFCATWEKVHNSRWICSVRSSTTTTNKELNISTKLRGQKGQNNGNANSQFCLHFREFIPLIFKPKPKFLTQVSGAADRQPISSLAPVGQPRPGCILGHGLLQSFGLFSFPGAYCPWICFFFKWQGILRNENCYVAKLNSKGRSLVNLTSKNRILHLQLW